MQLLPQGILIWRDQGDSPLLICTPGCPSPAPGSANLKQERFSGNEPLGACLPRPHPRFVDLTVAATPVRCAQMQLGIEMQNIEKP